MNHERPSRRLALPYGFLRFLGVGLVAFAVDFGLLWLLHDALGAPLWVATGTSFLLSFVVSYVLQRVVAFRSVTPHGRALIKYTLLVAFNTVATIIIVNLADHVIDSWGVGKVVAAAVTTTWNYFLYRWWIFPARTPPPASTPAEAP